MRAMVTKYSRSFPDHQEHDGKTPQDTKCTVLLTGSTGGLGCYLLALLACSPSVSRVYALNRVSQSSSGLLQRQELALIDRGLDKGIMNLDTLVFLEADLSAPRFGLPEHVYLEVRSMAITTLPIPEPFLDAAVCDPNYPQRYCLSLSHFFHY